ncbi:MAG: hypothetical protein QY322_03375 [bacterium]|nr:MAG: hypothetical protein QY322_03375 [bacterium]
MATLQQTKDEIDRLAQVAKDKTDSDAKDARQLAADQEIEAVRLETEYKIQEIKNNAQN